MLNIYFAQEFKKTTTKKHHFGWTIFNPNIQNFILRSEAYTLFMGQLLYRCNRIMHGGLHSFPTFAQAILYVGLTRYHCCSNLGSAGSE